MPLYNAIGEIINIDGGGDAPVQMSANLDGNELTINDLTKSIPSFVAQELPERTNIVQSCGYSDNGNHNHFICGLRFRNKKTTRTFSFSYTVSITGTASVFSSTLYGGSTPTDFNASTRVALGSDHVYSSGDVSATDVYELEQDYEYLAFGIYLATTKQTSSDRQATKRVLTLSSVPDGLELVGTFTVDCPTFTEDSLSYTQAEQLKKYANKWTGRFWCAMGDSITQQSDGYPFTASKILDVGYLLNAGRGGTTMVQNAGYLSGIRYQGADLITIAHGVNDFDNTPNSPLGTLAEHGSTFDTTTYIGAAQYIIETIQANSPNSQIVLIAPIYNPAGESGTNTLGLHLYEYRNALKSVAEDYGLYFINGYDIISVENSAGKYADGTHPNAVGYKYYGKALANILANMPYEM